MEFALVGAVVIVVILWFTHAVRRELAKLRAHELELKQLDVVQAQTEAQKSADDRATAEATLQIKQLEAQTAEDNRLAAEAQRRGDPRSFGWS